MPLYGYECQNCGPFEDWRPLSLAEADSHCPQCGGASPRQVSLPFVPCISHEARIAHARNERSMDRPRVVGRDDLHRFGRPRAHNHAHGRSMYSSVLGHAH